MPLETTPWNVQDALQTPEDCAAFLEAALAEAPDDPVFLSRVLGEVARARQDMSRLARETGISREGLRKALSAEGDPRLSTLTKVLSAMGLQLRVEAIPQHVQTQA